jgi:polyhydroxyalkanoate synthase
MFVLIDTLRQMQGHALERFGLGPIECSYRIAAAGGCWRLRAYGGAMGGPPLLIVAAPIKRPYIWDLAVSMSVVRHCLQHRLRVYLLEWLPPSPGGKAGLADYTERSIGAAVAGLAQDAGIAKPFIMGHSLGGTLAAIFAAIDAASVRGLVLLSTPLCFEPGSSRFRDALVAMAPTSLAVMDIVPGSLLTQLSMMASLETFLSSRIYRCRSERQRSPGIGAPCSGRALGVGRVCAVREARPRNFGMALSRKPLLRRNSPNP